MRAALATGALLAACTVQAQDTAAPQVVTVTQIAQPAADLAVATRVIDAAAIARMQAASVADLLEQVAGLHLDRPAGRAGTGSLSLRGADPNYTLVLVDGVALNDPTTSRGGAVDLGKLGVNAIERIEVVRAPMSSAWGSGALAGVIRIVTRPPGAAREAQATLRADDGGSGEARLRLSVPLAGDGGVTLAASAVDDPPADDGSHYRAREVAAAVQHGPWRLDFGHAQWRAAAFPDDSGGAMYAARPGLTHTASLQQRLALRWDRELDGAGVLRLEAQRLSARADEDAPGVAPGVRDPMGLPASLTHTRFTREALNAHWQRPLDAALTLATGASWTRERARTEGRLDFGGFALPTGFERRRHATAMWAELAARWAADWRAQGGLRVDAPAAAPRVVSPLVGVSWQPGGGAWRWKAHAARAFKEPSLYALGHPLIGNPALRPEHARSAGLGMAWQGRGAWREVALDAFASRYRDAIDFDPGPPPALVNRAALRTRGLELRLRMAPAAGWTLDADATALSARVEPSGEVPRGRPRHLGHATLGWQGAGAWSSHDAALVLRHVGAREDSSIPTGAQRLEAYTRLDARWRWRAARGIEWALVVRNLAGAHWQEAVGFAGTPRRVQLTLSLDGSDRR
ncbi:MAG TPA: TonB-dependent receptor [Burkholderiaceae bacterium]|nr:TonB-dependent receptor [Burkholderiaceae bacterium]